MKILYLVELNKTSRFWYPRVALDAWIDFSSRTAELRLSECWENLHFCFFLSLYPISFPPPLLFCFPLPHFSFLIHQTYFSFCLFPHLIFSFFSYFSQFPFFHLLLYLFFFIFSFLHLIWIASTEWSKSGGNFPPLSSIATCHSHIFFLIFMIFLFP